MKRLLNKLFFWNVPAQGAFFALTLLYILPRLCLTVYASLLLPLLLKERSAVFWFGLPMAAICLALLYALVCFWHAIPKKRLSWKAVAIALCACAVLLLGFWGIVPKELEHWWWLFPAVLVVCGICYVFYPAIKLWQWAYALVALGLALGAFYFVNRATVRSQIALLDPFTEAMTVNSGISTSLQWVLVVCYIVLMVSSYLLWGRFIAKCNGIPFKSLFGRGVATLWGIFAIAYLTSLSMAFYAMHDYRKAKGELEAYWGMPAQIEVLEEQYQTRGQIDQSFWDELNTISVDFSDFYQQYDGIDGIVGYRDAVLPDDIHAQWRKVFTESTELRRAEELLDTPLPLPDRRGQTRLERSRASINMDSQCRMFARLEAWRIRLALDDKDIQSAQKALERIDNICAFLQKDYVMLNCLVGYAMEPIRAEALTKILASGLADETWLRGQYALLEEKERQIPEMHKRMILGHAAEVLETMDTYTTSSSTPSFLLLPESQFLWGHDCAAIARGHKINDFSDYPEKPDGILAGMMANSLRSLASRNFPKLTTTVRISRALIDAELRRLETGSYPVTMENLPTDPFSGEPLKYVVGVREVTEQHFQLIEEAAPVQIDPYEALRELDLSDEASSAFIEVLDDVQQKLGWSDEEMAEIFRPHKYDFKFVPRQITAVQVWSVGADGVDNGGSSAVGADGFTLTDDICFFIPTADTNQ